MFLKKKTKPFVVGILVGLLLSGSIVFATNNEYILTLFKAKIVVNGVEVQGSDREYQYFNGQTYVPTSLIYSGTTYVPLKFFSEALQQPVSYEPKTTTIFVGQVPTNDKVEQYMSDILKPYYNNTFTLYTVNRKMLIGGKEYNKGYSMFDSLNEGTVSYNLEAKYSRINGLIGLDDTSNKSDATVQIFADEKLIKTISIKSGSLEQQLNLDVTGVIKLEIKFNTTSQINFVDLKIK